MARAALRVGDLVRPTASGMARSEALRLWRNHVLRIDSRLSNNVYGRPAFTVSCGDEATVVWASHVKLLRSRKRERNLFEDEDTDE